MELNKRGKSGVGKKKFYNFSINSSIMSRKLHVRTCQTKRTCVWFCWIFSGDQERIRKYREREGSR
jgi:hypothetical protein